MFWLPLLAGSWEIIFFLKPRALGLNVAQAPAISVGLNVAQATEPTSWTVELACRSQEICEDVRRYPESVPDVAEHCMRRWSGER